MGMHEAVVVLRGLVLALSLPVIWLSFSGFCRFGRGDQGFSNGLRSIALLGGVSTGSYQLRFFAEGTGGYVPGPSVLLSLTMSIALLVVSMLLLWRIRGRDSGQLDFLERHIDVSLAISELDALDRDAAQALAADCRRRVALKLLESPGG